MSNGKPNFDHDCDSCTFLGCLHREGKTYDLYYCKRGGPTVIARFGSEGPDYMSGLELARKLKRMGKEGEKSSCYPLVIALDRAIDKELTKPMCERCGENPVAYPGARFCGAACSQESEMKQ